MTVLIAGLGLLGGSLALALKEQGVRVLALGRNQERLDTAARAGLVDGCATIPEAVAPEADLVVIGTPVGSIPATAEQLLPFLRPGTIITDMGSTKEWVCNNLTRICRGSGIAFVGSHPMAGSEKTGFEHSRADLFRAAVVVLTETPATTPAALETVHALWESVEARVIAMSPEHHDQLVARTSHLPHAVAFAMAYCLSRHEDAADNFAGVYGKGLTDTLRIAASDPVMWEDIIRTNRRNIADALEEYRGYLAVLENWIRQGHYTEIADLIRAAGELRKGL